MRQKTRGFIPSAGPTADSLRNMGSLYVTRKYRLGGGIGAVYNCQISKLTY